MSDRERRAALLLAWTWPVPGAFDACPLRGALWCFALERAELHAEDLEHALRLVHESGALSGDRAAS